MDARQAADLIDRFMRAANAQDVDDLRNIFAEDVAVEWPQSGERFHGKEACVNIFLHYPGGSPRFLGLTRVLGEGKTWTAEAEMLYPDNKRFLVVSIFQIADDRITHEIDYFTEPFPAPEWRKNWLPAE